MMTSIAVPHRAEQKEIYLDTILASIQAVVGGVAAGPLAHYKRTLSMAMRDVRHHFKAHCAHNVQSIYGLYLEDDGNGYIC